MLDSRNMSMKVELQGLTESKEKQVRFAHWVA